MQFIPALELIKHKHLHKKKLTASSKLAATAWISDVVGIVT